ncbi:MAG TPA: hypothetical protein VGX23_26750 [Actinocrinis sp.]|nr:hypothetical protein [Actinocrinis sp.]
MPGPMIEALVQQLDRAQDEPVVLRLRTPGGLPALNAADWLHTWAQYHQYPFLRLRAGTAAPTAFGPVRELLRLLLPAVQRESGAVLGDFLPELAVLLPELRTRPRFAETAALSSIATGAAKRRLDRDSERLRRLVAAVAEVAGAGLAGLGRSYGRPPVILIEQADLCDRHTLACLLRLWQRAEGPGPVTVLATSPAGPDRPRWAARPQSALGGLDGALLAGWTDAEGEQDLLLRRFLAATGAVDLPGQYPGDPVRPGASTDLGSLPPQVADRLVSAAVLGDPALAAAIEGPLDGPLAALALVPGTRRAILRQLTAEQYRAACRALADKLRTTQAGPAPDRPDPGREGVEAALAFLEVSGGDHAAGAGRALRLARQSFGFTLNPELILLCCRIALAAGESAADRQPALLYAALAHAYLDHPETAAEIFEAAYAAAGQPELRAQISYYQGLLAAKRLGRLDEGRVWFERGLVQVAGQRTVAARLEAGWLRNGLALVAWRQQRRSEAQILVCSALADTEDCAGDVQLAGLRVSLIGNLSVLQEDQGGYPAALATWRSLEPLSRSDPDGAFAKPYLYRESWLLLQAGQVAKAYESAVAALEVARRHRDVVHMHVIGSACVYLACRLSRFADAQAFAHAGLDLSAELGRQPARAHAAGQLAHVYYQAGRQRDARNWMRQAAAAAGGGPPGKLYRAALACMSDARGPISLGPISRGLVALGPDAELYGVALDRPQAGLPTSAALAAHLIAPERGREADAEEPIGPAAAV